MDDHHGSTLSAVDIFDDHDQFGSDDHVNKLAGDDLFSILECLEADVVDFPPLDETGFAGTSKFDSDETTSSTTRLVSQKSTSSSTLQGLSETELDVSPKNKRLKVSTSATTNNTSTMTTLEEVEAILNPSDGQVKMSHITVERNRRKQMNEHLSVLRSLMPCFYVKRVSVKDHNLVVS